MGKHVYIHFHDIGERIPMPDVVRHLVEQVNAGKMTANEASKKCPRGWGIAWGAGGSRAVAVTIPGERDSKRVRDCGCGGGKDAVNHGTYTSTVYKGYMIINGIMSPEIFWIKKDGFNIGSAKSEQEAKKIIDQLV